MTMIQDAQDILETTLANSATFRTFVGAANVAEARQRIHHDYIPDREGEAYTPEELSAIRPCALIYTLPSGGFTTQRDASGTNNWATSGRLVCVLMRDTPESGSNSDVDVGFRTIAGNIMSDIINLSEDAADSFLAATRIVADGPFRTEESDLDELGDRQAFELIIDWGNRQ